MNTAFLFPGQGSQYAGMAQDLYERFPAARDIIQRGDDVLGKPLSETMFGSFEGADDRLRQTEYTQPALFIHSVAANAVLAQNGVRPDAVAGHSVGEYAALSAAGAVSFEEGLQIVSLRGKLMANAGTSRPGTMAAILGLDNHQVERVCAEASTESEVVCAANYNSTGQVVISGDVSAVERASEMAREAGAKRVVPLSVSGAFHSPLMTDARDGLAEALQKATIREPECPIYLNVTAEPTRDPEEVRTRLLDQLLSPVRWSQTMQHMQRDGMGRMVEVGAGKVLIGLARRTLGRDLDTAAAGTAEELDALARQTADTK